MITVHDFTLLPEGKFVPLEGAVVRCPRCNRTGVFEKEPAGARCVHEETIDVSADGMRIEHTDCCELTRA